MKNFIQEIDNIISKFNNLINDKIAGINYLEKLKYFLIDEIKQLNIASYSEFEKYEIKQRYGDNNLAINIENYLDQTLKIKNTIENDCLSLVLIGNKTFEVYENLNSNKSVNLKLNANKAVVFSKGVVVSESIAKNTIIIEITNIRHNSVIE